MGSSGRIVGEIIQSLYIMVFESDDSQLFDLSLMSVKVFFSIRKVIDY